MPTTTLYSKSGAEVGTVDLPETLFNVEVNPDLLHQAVTAQLAGRRTGTHAVEEDSGQSNRGRDRQRDDQCRPHVAEQCKQHNDDEQRAQ